jgi:CMP-N-acetylneuraminic acid synthetase
LKTLITILARSGSKGLPNKHLLPFNGKPLIEWTIWNAKDFAGEIDADVFAASDSTEIISLAESLGVKAISRNPKHATDKAGKVDAIRDLYVQLDEKYDCIIDLDATNPCRRMEDLHNAFGIFSIDRPKTLFSVVKSKKNPYFNQVERRGRFIELPVHTACFCRQDAPEVFDLNCNIYIYDTKWLQDGNNKSAITDNSEIYLMPEWTFCDIDCKADKVAAEALHKEYILKKDGDVQSKKQDCSCSGWHGTDRFSGHGCATQARGIYFND